MSRKADAMKEQFKLVIKKYPNRRLYDVSSSQYVTLDDMVRKIKEGYEVQVIDSKTNQDITQNVLTQIFVDQSGPYLFSTSFLHQMIRNREGFLGEFFTNFIPKLLDSYLEMLNNMKRQISTLTTPIISSKNWLAATSKDLKMHLLNPFNAPDTEVANQIETAPTPAKLIEKSTPAPSKTDSIAAKKASGKKGGKEEQDVVSLLLQKITELESRIQDVERQDK
ncbi:MAG: polyhydroxyalkanoate synthesis regulator DNA-binding domain-containing protein [SAR324 cluster bacterium]|nr:polyhydroxyalkanoate synthesis regulator DNA-binding domain-containing protein [SAR324 cluster bacterium]